MAAGRTNFSKSKLIAAWQCHKRLYLDRFHKDLADQSDDREAIFEVGHRVGAIAQEQYGNENSVEIPYNRNTSKMLAETKALFDKGLNDPVFEATFQHEGVLIRADVMIPDGDRWDVIEVKSGTSAKDVNKFDCAIQFWVMRGAGLDIKSISLAYVNNQFEYQGDGNYDGLIKKEDVTEEAEALQDEVEVLLVKAREAVAGELPEIPVGKHCKDPYECEFMSTCWPQGAEYPITGIGGTRKDIFDWVNRGLEDIRDIPEDEIKGAKRQWIYDVTNAGTPEVRDGLKEDFESLPYPRYYLDFETVAPAIPVWAGTRPYQSVPVQWSIHIDDGSGDGSLATLRHEEFLDLSGEPPMRALAEQMIDCLGDAGPVLMYTSYELGVIKNLISRFPDLEQPLLAIIDRLFDLAKVVGQYYYHPSMLGSWSIKKVAPAIAPHMDYEGLDGINQGTAASEGFLEAIHLDTTPARKAELEEQLLRYCRFDTEAMVEIVRVLSKDKE